MRIYLNSTRMLLQVRGLKSSSSNNNIWVRMRSKARLRGIQWIKLDMCNKVIVVVIIIVIIICVVNLIHRVTISFNHSRIPKAKHDRRLVNIPDKYLPCNRQNKKLFRGGSGFNLIVFCLWFTIIVRVALRCYRSRDRVDSTKKINYNSSSNNSRCLDIVKREV